MSHACASSPPVSIGSDFQAEPAVWSYEPVQRQRSDTSLNRHRVWQAASLSITSSRTRFTKSQDSDAYISPDSCIESPPVALQTPFSPYASELQQAREALGISDLHRPSFTSRFTPCPGTPDKDHFQNRCIDPGPKAANDALKGDTMRIRGAAAEANSERHRMCVHFSPFQGPVRASATPPRLDGTCFSSRRHSYGANGSGTRSRSFVSFQDTDARQQTSSKSVAWSPGSSSQSFFKRDAASLSLEEDEFNTTSSSSNSGPKQRRGGSGQDCIPSKLKKISWDTAADRAYSRSDSVKSIGISSQLTDTDSGEESPQFRCGYRQATKG